MTKKSVPKLLEDRVAECEERIDALAQFLLRKADGKPKAEPRRPKRYRVTTMNLLKGGVQGEPLVLTSPSDVGELTGYTRSTVQVRLSQNGNTWRTATRKDGTYYVVEKLDG